MEVVGKKGKEKYPKKREKVEEIEEFWEREREREREREKRKYRKYMREWDLANEVDIVRKWGKR